jgi:hypothetical protein
MPFYGRPTPVYRKGRTSIPRLNYRLQTVGVHCLHGANIFEIPVDIYKSIGHITNKYWISISVLYYEIASAKDVTNVLAVVSGISGILPHCNDKANAFADRLENQFQFKDLHVETS